MLELHVDGNQLMFEMLQQIESELVVFPSVCGGK